MKIRTEKERHKHAGEIRETIRAISTNPVLKLIAERDIEIELHFRQAEYVLENENTRDFQGLNKEDIKAITTKCKESHLIGHIDGYGSTDSSRRPEPSYEFKRLIESLIIRMNRKPITTKARIHTRKIRKDKCKKELEQATA